MLGVIVFVLILVSLIGIIHELMTDMPFIFALILLIASAITSYAVTYPNKYRILQMAVITILMSIGLVLILDWIVLDWLGWAWDDHNYNARPVQEL